MSGLWREREVGREDLKMKSEQCLPIGDLVQNDQQLTIKVATHNWKWRICPILSALIHSKAPGMPAVIALAPAGLFLLLPGPHISFASPSYFSSQPALPTALPAIPKAQSF